MSEKEQPEGVESAVVSRKLLQLYDEFAEFNEQCAFLCDAFSSLVAHNDCMDENTVNGFIHYSLWLKQQIGDFKTKIRQVQIVSRNDCL